MNRKPYNHQNYKRSIAVKLKSEVSQINKESGIVLDGKIASLVNDDPEIPPDEMKYFPRKMWGLC